MQLTPVILDDDTAWGWADVFAPAATHYCERVKWWRMHRRDGWVLSLPFLCGTWFCRRRCCRQLAQTELDHALRTFEVAGTVWYARFSDDEQLMTRLRVRRHRARAATLVVKRIGGEIHLFASVPLTGREPPAEGQWLTPELAFDQLRTAALVLPGVRKLTWAGRWKPRASSAPGSGAYLQLGLLSAEVFDEAFELAADEVEARLGRRPDQSFLPDGLPIEDWRRLLEEKLRLVRQRTPQPADGGTDADVDLGDSAARCNGFHIQRSTYVKSVTSLPPPPYAKSVTSGLEIEQ